MRLRAATITEELAFLVTSHAPAFKETWPGMPPADFHERTMPAPDIDLLTCARGQEFEAPAVTAC